MRHQETSTSADVHDLFVVLVKDLHEAGFAPAVGADSGAPSIWIRHRPERRSLGAQFTRGATPTIVRFYVYAAYLHHLDNSFPRLFEQLLAACHPGRPFLVIEGWIRYVELGERLLRLARRHGLNVHCMLPGGRESRLNGVRIHYHHASHRWCASDGPVDEWLRDPRRRARSRFSGWNPRWFVRRAADRLGFAMRKAAALIIP